MNKFIFTIFGIVFGFLLSRAGATTYDFYANLFLFKDLQLLWVIAAAAGTGAVGMAILKKFRQQSLMGEHLTFEAKPYRKSLIPGSLLLGAGWGMAGACPGTVLAMAGEGKLAAIFTVVGIALGTYFYGLWNSRKMPKVATAESAEVVQ